MNEQQNFWAFEYANEYISKNSKFNAEKGQDCWRKMLAKAEGINSILECGCNIGRNIEFLNAILPESSKSIIEISKGAFDYVTKKYKLNATYNGSIVDATFEVPLFDLVFTSGVLIHVHPDDLLSNMSKIFSFSNKYILFAEYFNREPVMIEYQGKKNRLFKRDFGRLFIQNYPVKLVDYGFHWGYINDDAGFDDITWWLFEKT